MNERWIAMQAQCPRLRQDVRVHRHRYRDQPWYVLEDPLTGRFQRLDARAWSILRLLDGVRSVAEVLEVRNRTADTPLDEREFTSVLDSLHAAELVDWGNTPDAHALHQKHRRALRSRHLARLRSPLSIRFRLCDPDEWLQGMQPLARVLFGPVGCVVWLAALVLGAGALISDWPTFTGYWSARGFTAQSLLVMSLVYVGVKLVHELAHGLAARRWGGEVHEMGLMLLLLMPVPYVDVSSTWAFPEKGRRMIVGAAGILAELLLAAAAAVVFVSVESGLLRDVAYTTVLVGSVSTLAFNGNPLLRFDAYYVLADAVEIPNLSSRSSRYWGYLARRYLFGLVDAPSPVVAAGEKAWFIGYGACSSIYRVAVVLGIAMLVASVLPVLGAVLAVWAILGQLGVSVIRQLGFVLSGPALRGRRLRALTVCLALTASLTALATLVPLPLSTHAQGVVWLPEHASLRAGTEGYVAELLIQPGTRVQAGTPILRMENAYLSAHRRALEWELAELKTRQYAARLKDRVQAQVLAGDMDALRQELASVKEELASLVIASETAGTLVIPRARELEGRFLKKGERVAYVMEQGSPTIRVVVPRSEIGSLRRGVVGSDVRLAQSPRRTVPAVITRQVPKATRTLPSAALGALGGGLIAVDPGDRAGLTAAEGVFVIDLALEPGAPAAFAGGRAYVRFQHQPEPLAGRVMRGVRRLFLARLGV